MGVSTNGYVCFGFLLEEGAPMPWDDHEEIEAWWFKEKVGRDYESYEEYSLFLRENPCPVELVNACSLSHPMWILALAGTVRTALRGGPEIINPKSLHVKDEDKMPLIRIMSHYEIDHIGEGAQWYLASYWET